MKNIAVLMNTNEVGGAERSLVFQLKNHSENQLTFFLPRISSSRNLEEFLRASGFENIQYYNYPKSFYLLSRNNFKPNIGMFKELYNLASSFFWDHVVRYWWAAKQAKDLDVLDCGCGKGYGAFILSQFAKTVTAVDLNEHSLKIAKKSFADFLPEEKLNFFKQDIFKLNELGKKFDLIVAFEVIEHIPPETTDEFLLSLENVLKPGGTLLISTPNHDVVMRSRVSVPSFHINNFKAIELRNVLSKHFFHVEMLGQFKKRKFLNHLFFSLDFFNLRHTLKNWNRPHLRTVANDILETGEELDEKESDQLLKADDFKKYPEDQFNSYRFSPCHWRQAGLTIARMKKKEIHNL